MRTSTVGSIYLVDRRVITVDHHTKIMIINTTAMLNWEVASIDIIALRRIVYVYFFISILSPRV